MIFLAGYNPNLLLLALCSLAVLIPGIFLRRIKQPYIIAYIFAGILIGEHGFGIFTDKEFITQVGEFGLILLLFFIGMEISLPDLVTKWKTATLGVLIQVVGSGLMVWLLGLWLGWEMSRIIMLGFVISLSSSAVVIKLLQDSEEIQSPIGQDVLSILLMQDIIIVPMLIATNFLGGNVPSSHEMTLQIIGGVLIVLSMIWLFRKKELHLPYSQGIAADPELGVFIAFFVCFSFALVTGYFGLSAALGAFVGGIFVHAARSTGWIHDSLHSFRVVFVAVFFVSVGMLIDLHFLMENWKTVLLLLSLVFLSNHFLNSLILKIMGNDWKESLYGGALLAQIGELSFVLAAIGFSTHIIGDYGYQITIAVIALSLLISPFWIAATKNIIHRRKSQKTQNIQI